MNKDRRKFLKILLIGSGTLLVGKVMGPLFSGLLDNSVSKERPFRALSSSENQSDSSGSFRIVEDKKTFSIYDKVSGEEIFQIDKGA